MGEEISSDIQLTNEEFELLQKAIHCYRKQCIRNSKIALHNFTGKVSTETKIEQWLQTAEELIEIESKLAQAFM